MYYIYLNPLTVKMNTIYRIPALCVFFIFSLHAPGAQVRQPEEPLMTFSGKGYPRIEIYTQKEGIDTDVRRNKDLMVYGGIADPRPYIIRETAEITEAQTEALLNTELRALPFLSPKEPVTLRTYFEDMKDREVFNFLFPKDLDDYTQMVAGGGEDQSLLAYRKTVPYSVTVLWLDELHWYVDNVYYSSNAALDTFVQNAQKEVLTEGKIQDFLDLYWPFQYKLSEGLPYLQLPENKSLLPETGVVLGYALSPGMPGTESYDHKVTVIGNLDDGKIYVDRARLAALLLEAKAIDWDELQHHIPASSHPDGQVVTLTIWHGGYRYRILDPGYNAPGSAEAVFAQKVKALLVPETNTADR